MNHLGPILVDSSTAVFIDLSGQYNINRCLHGWWVFGNKWGSRSRRISWRQKLFSYMRGMRWQIWISAQVIKSFSCNTIFKLFELWPDIMVLPLWLINATSPVFTAPRLIHLWHVRHCFCWCPLVFLPDPSGGSSNETSKPKKIIVKGHQDVLHLIWKQSRKLGFVNKHRVIYASWHIIFI